MVSKVGVKNTFAISWGTDQTLVPGLEANAKPWILALFSLFSFLFRQDA